jgi:hypothetical protein
LLSGGWHCNSNHGQIRSFPEQGSFRPIKKKTTIIARIGLISATLKHRRSQSESPALPMTSVCAIIELHKMVIWWMSVDLVSSVKCQQEQIQTPAGMGELWPERQGRD